jgi:dynactin complex subunit
MIPLRDDLSDD